METKNLSKDVNPTNEEDSAVPSESNNPVECIEIAQTEVNNCCENIEPNMQKSIELEDELREKLKDFPEVLEFIGKLQRVIQKQVKKIIKWKTRVKQLTEKKSHNVSTQTPFDGDTTESVLEIGSEGEGEDSKEEKSLTENIREAAEQAVQSSGFVYEETSGLYYDYNSGYYYNAEYGLYYDGVTGTYLKYNQDSQSYEFHSQVGTGETKPLKKDHEKQIKRRSKNETKVKDTKRQRRDGFDEEPEEGECSGSSFTSDEESSVSDSSDVCKQWPPCMRMIVESTEIPKIKVGSLFIITCDGGTIGREGNHSVSLPDINVSKHHLQIRYDSDNCKYVIIDLGSRNGTILNSKRLSSSKQESEPFEVPHGSKLQLGSTTLLCHIHEGTQTCGHCEPGLLIEEEKDPPLAINSTKKSINQQFKSELRRLRKQHGFLGSKEDPSKLGDGYTDRAQKRRDEVGSQNPYEKTETASVDASISSENKGFKLLSKMGWKEGQSLGKDGSGVKEPVQVVSNVGTSGMGATAETSVPDKSKSTKQTIWKKTQERFDKLPNKALFNEDSDE